MPYTKGGGWGWCGWQAQGAGGGGGHGSGWAMVAGGWGRRAGTMCGGVWYVVCVCSSLSYYIFQNEQRREKRTMVGKRRSAGAACGAKGSVRCGVQCVVVCSVQRCGANPVQISYPWGMLSGAACENSRG